MFSVLMILLRILTFLFFSSIVHRHRLSFPTRRSSDLGYGTPMLREPSVLTFVAGDPATCTRLGVASALRLIRYECRCNTDRKSTRLNSSHVSNSYAVCCLKITICAFVRRSSLSPP